MAYDVVVEDSFERDYEAIVEYLETVLHNSGAAKRIVLSVRNAVSLLEANPQLHAVSRKPVLANHTMRECAVENYVLVYRVDDDKKIIRLHRMFHQSQQYDDRWYWLD